MRRRVAVLLYLSLPAALLSARPAIGCAQSARAAGAWLAVALNSPFPTRLGTRHRDFYALGLRRAWTLGAFPGVTLNYAGDLLPIVVSTNNVNGFEVRPCGGGCSTLVLQTGTVYGAGLAPVGLTADLGPVGPIAVQLHASAGVLWFTRAVPDPEAEQFNFTATAGVGVKIPLRTGYAALVGYLRHHTSNGGIGRVNPGLDSHMLYIGMMHFRRAKPFSF